MEVPSNYIDSRFPTESMEGHYDHDWIMTNSDGHVPVLLRAASGSQAVKQYWYNSWSYNRRFLDKWIKSLDRLTTTHFRFTVMNDRTDIVMDLYHSDSCECGYVRSEADLCPCSCSGTVYDCECEWSCDYFFTDCESLCSCDINDIMDRELSMDRNELLALFGRDQVLARPLLQW